MNKLEEKLYFLKNHSYPFKVNSRIRPKKIENIANPAANERTYVFDTGTLNYHLRVLEKISQQIINGERFKNHTHQDLLLAANQRVQALTDLAHKGTLNITQATRQEYQESNSIYQRVFNILENEFDSKKEHLYKNCILYNMHKDILELDKVIDKVTFKDQGLLDQISTEFQNTPFYIGINSIANKTQVPQNIIDSLSLATGLHNYVGESKGKTTYVTANSGVLIQGPFVRDKKVLNSPRIWFPKFLVEFRKGFPISFETHEQMPIRQNVANSLVDKFQKQDRNIYK